MFLSFVSRYSKLIEPKEGFLVSKKMHNLKVENYVLFGGISEDLNPLDSL